MQKSAIIAVLALTLSVPAAAQQAVNPYLANVPLSAGPITLPVSPAGRGTRPYEMSRTVSPAEKNAMMKQIMPMMGMVKSMDVKDVMNMMAIKYPAKKGLSFDDVKASMELSANKLNFKKVGSNSKFKIQPE
jgi:hypothetical protein